MAEPSQFMTPKSAAKFLCKNVETIRRYARKGVLKAFKLRPSNEWRFLRSDVEALLVGPCKSPELSDRAQDIEAHVQAARDKHRRRSCL